MEEESKQEFAFHNLHRHSHGHGLLPQHTQILQFSSPHHHLQSQHIPSPFSSYNDPPPLLPPFNNVGCNVQNPFVALNGSSNVQNSLATTYHSGLNLQNSITNSIHGGSNVHNFLPSSFHGELNVQNSLPSNLHGSPDVHNSGFIPFSGMADSMQQNLATSRIFSLQQQVGQTRLRAHDLLNPTCHLPNGSFPSPVPSTAMAIAGETRHNQHSEAGCEDVLQKEGDISKDLLSSVSLTRNATEKVDMAKEQGADSNAPSSALHLSPNFHRHIHPASRHSESSTDLCLQQNPEIYALPEFAPPATSLLHDSSAVGKAPPRVQMKELSSFQNISLCSSLSSKDQVLDSRKRPWGCIQDLECRMEAIRGVDLNASADEIQSESTEQDTCVSVPSIRDGWSLSPVITPKLMMREENKLKMSDTCNECGSRGGEKCRAMMETPDMSVDITGLSLRKTTLKYDMRDAGLGAPDFLTLGPICSIQELGSIPLRNGSRCASITRKPIEDADNYIHQNASQNQTNGVAEVICMPEATDELLERCQMKVESIDKFAWRVEDQCSSYLPQSQTEEYLDLELRLSI